MIHLKKKPSSQSSREKVKKKPGKTRTDTISLFQRIARWSVLSSTSENIGEKIDSVCRIIEKENPDLDGVLIRHQSF
jgi:hypothetical protein